MPVKYVRFLDNEAEPGVCDATAVYTRPPFLKLSNRATYFLSAALVISLLFNCYQAYLLARNSSGTECASKYAGLLRNQAIELTLTSEYSSLNRTVQDAAWSQDRMRSENGAVALENAWTEEMGLPHSMRSPWNGNKGIYVVMSSHEMHCLHTMRALINDVHEGRKIKTPYPHHMHCLDILRQSVMCHADDTLLYTGRLNAQAQAAIPEVGIGSVKLCRNWDRLQSWAKSHSACYRPLDFADPSITELDRYKFCPDGSRPWETAA